MCAAQIWHATKETTCMQARQCHISVPRLTLLYECHVCGAMPGGAMPLMLHRHVCVVYDGSDRGSRGGRGGGETLTAVSRWDTHQPAEVPSPARCGAAQRLSAERAAYAALKIYRMHPGPIYLRTISLGAVGSRRCSLLS